MNANAIADDFARNFAAAFGTFPRPLGLRANGFAYFIGFRNDGDDTYNEVVFEIDGDDVTISSLKSFGG